MDRAGGNRNLWLLNSTAKRFGPERLAAAIALGLLAGLVPKLNLLAVILYALMVLLPIPTLLAVMVSVVVAVISPALDGVADTIGAALLGNASLRSLWLSLEQWPLVPWLALHNTVVLGHFVIGMVVLAPTYLISCRVLERWWSPGMALSSSVDNYAPVTADEDELAKPQSDRAPRGPALPERHRRDVPTETPVERSPLIVPPPKFNRAPDQDRVFGRGSAATPDEPVLFEPIDEVTAAGDLLDPLNSVDSAGSRDSATHSLNAWHMQRAMGDGQKVAAHASRPSERSASAAKAKEPTQRPGVPHAKPTFPASQSDDQPTGPLGDQLSETGKVGDGLAGLAIYGSGRSDVMNSMQLAQNASDVLAWVDDLLDECMAEEGMSLISPAKYLDVGPSSADSTSPSSGGVSPDQTMELEHDGEQSRWLLETTIEIVRLSDESLAQSLLMADSAMPYPVSDGEVEHGHSDRVLNAQLYRGAVPDMAETSVMENSVVMNAEPMTRAWPKVGGAATASDPMPPALPSQDSGEPTILSLNPSVGRSGEKRLSPAFQQLVMAGSSKEPHVGTPTPPIEPVKGECLAYLLGHLRHEREGKSS